MTKPTLKIRLHEIMERAQKGDVVSRNFDIFLIALVVTNVMAAVLETVKGIHDPYEGYFYAFEVFSIIIFTIEYALRLWACTVNPMYADPVRGRLRYAMTPLAIIDLIAILPFYIHAFLPMDLRFVRVFRLLRMLRILKIARYSEAFNRIIAVIAKKKSELFLTVFLLLVLLVFASSVLYTLEYPAQPEKFSSIPAAMWWGVATLTTVGYGDIYPITPLGKMFAGIVAIIGIGIIALPGAIIVASYFEHRDSSKAFVCPRCKKKHIPNKQ